MAIPYTIETLDKERKLRLDYKALAELRHLADVKPEALNAVIKSLGNNEIPDPMVVGKILWIAMRSSAPKMTLDEAWEIIGTLGNNLDAVQARAIEIMVAVIKDSLGTEEESKNVKTPTEN